MPIGQKPSDEFINETEELRKGLTKAGGIAPLEVHNRFVMLWVGSQDYLDKFEPKPIISQQGHTILMSDMDYIQQKLMIGTICTKYLDGTKPTDDDNRCLRWFRDHIRQSGPKLIWKLDDIVKINITALLKVTEEAFFAVWQRHMRPCDARIMMSFISPQAWANTKITDFILRYENDQTEINRMHELIDPLIDKQFGGIIKVHVRTYSDEFLAFMHEHFKVQFNFNETARLKGALRRALTTEGIFEVK